MNDKEKHVCGLTGFGALEDVCPACSENSNSYKLKQEQQERARLIDNVQQLALELESLRKPFEVDINSDLEVIERCIEQARNASYTEPSATPVLKDAVAAILALSRIADALRAKTIINKRSIKNELPIEPIDKFMTRIWNRFFSRDAEGTFSELQRWIEADRVSMQSLADQNGKHNAEGAQLALFTYRHAVEGMPCENDEYIKYESDFRRWYEEDVTRRFNEACANQLASLVKKDSK